MLEPYYDDGTVTIYHGDSREILPHITADVLVTDPPYGVDLGNHRGATEKRRGHVLRRSGYSSYEDTPENFDAIVVPVIRAALQRTERGVVFCAAHMAWKLPQPAAMGGVFIPNACGRSPWGFASIAHCLLYGSAPNLHKGAKATALRSTDSVEMNGHPCPKPLGWMRWAVDLASSVGDVVLDPFAGSGTTLRAAKDLGRRAIGVELEERYCEIAARRCAQDVLALDAA